MTQRGMSIHIGLNSLSGHYTNSTFNYLTSSHNDAKYMAEIASHTFKEAIPFSKSINQNLMNKSNLLLLDSDATTDNLISIIDEIALDENKRLVAGDTLLITFSGHGSQIPSNEQPVESDGQDETWCFYDRQFIDEEIFELFTKFQKGVRIIVVSDSCNNGTVIGNKEMDILDSNKMITFVGRFNLNNFENKILNAKEHAFAKYDNEIWEKDKIVLAALTIETTDKSLQKNELIEIKQLPKSLAKSVYETHNDIYKEKQYEVRSRLLLKVRDKKKRDRRELIDASVILISACQDWQITAPGKNETELSKFTYVFKEVWEKKEFTNYLELHQKLWEHFDSNVKNLSDIQHPNYYKIGTPDSAFELQMPFTV